MNDIDDGFGFWFSGITDGEGCFGCVCGEWRITPFYRISLRSDDKPVLDYIFHKLGIGRRPRIFMRNGQGKYKSNPMAWFQVSRISDLLNLIGLFEKYPLRAKKKNDFEIWKQIVLSVHARGQTDNPNALSLAKQLKEIRRYRDPKEEASK